MTVKYGFYNSLAGDRVYSAEDISGLFEGIITDGIFQPVGGWFVVSAVSGMSIKAAPGRAWFNNTWISSDADFGMTVATAHLVLNRIDTVVIEINKNTGVRANSIKIITGTPASVPVPPTLSDSGGIYQYPLADIYVGVGVSSINTGNITNRIGADKDTPFVTGIVDVIDVTEFFAQFEYDFTVWFQNLQDELDSNQAANLQSQIDDIEAVLTPLEPRVTDLEAYDATVEPRLDALEAADISLDSRTDSLESRATALEASDTVINTKITGLNNGWVEVTDTWTYASAKTVTVPTDATLKYRKSMKVRFKQGGAYKYFYTTIVAATLLTFLETTTNTVANAAITDVAYSFVAEPFGFPNWMTWTPTVTGFSGSPTVQGLIRLTGDTCEIHLNITGTSNATTFTVTNLPLAPSMGWATSYMLGESKDAGAINVPNGRVQLTDGSVVGTFRSSPGVGAWTASGTKSATGFVNFKY